MPWPVQMLRSSKMGLMCRPTTAICSVVLLAALVAPRTTAGTQITPTDHTANKGIHHTRGSSAGCGSHGIPCPEGHHSDSATAASAARHTLSSHNMQHKKMTAHRAAAAHHADVTITPHRTTEDRQHTAAGKKEPGCRDFAMAFGEESMKYAAEHADLDVPVGIDPATGREVEEEDLAEAVIAEEAEKAGVDALEYENSSGVETHSAAAHHAAFYNFPSNHAYRLTYTLSIYFTEKAINAAKWTMGDVYHLTQIMSSENHTLIESFEQAVADAIAPILPHGVAAVKATNVVPGEPVDVDIVVYPNLLIPEEINPSGTLLAVDKVMHQFEASHFAPWFLQRYGVAEVQIMSAPGNQREIAECAEVFPFEGLPGSKGRGLGHSLAMALLVWCPLLLASVATARHGVLMYQRHKRVSVLPKGSMRADCDGSKSACGSSGGVVPNVANIYAAPADYYAGPYRTSYSSGGASCSSSHRGSSGGGALPTQPVTTTPFQAAADGPCPRGSHE